MSSSLALHMLALRHPAPLGHTLKIHSARPVSGDAVEEPIEHLFPEEMCNEFYKKYNVTYH